MSELETNKIIFNELTTIWLKDSNLNIQLSSYEQLSAKGKNHFLIVAKDETKIDLKGLKDKINSTKLSFASEERLQKYLGVTRGSVSPLCILNDEENAVKVFIEKSVENETRIAVHPNDNTATVYIATKDVENIIKEHGNSVEYITL